MSIATPSLFVPSHSGRPLRSTSPFIVQCLIAALLLLVATGAMAEPVAMVVRASGEVVRITPDGERMPLERRDTLNTGDRIETGEQARVTLKFADEGLVELGTGSRFVIQQYRSETDSDEDPNVLLELIEGRLRTVTGALARDPDDYDLKTPLASIGIRGTEFEVWQSAETGTRVRLSQGSVSLADLAGQGDPVILTENNPFGEVRPGAAARFIEEWTGPSMGAFPAELLSIPVPAVLPPLAPPVPAAVPLAADVPATAVADDEEEPDALARFVQAVNQNQWDTARLLADELLDRFEGTPRFDLYYALLLLHENRTQEAIFALERVLAYAPDQHRARLELARAYFANKNLARARTEFERVLATDPPANVRTNIESFLARIDAAEQARNQQFNLYAGLEAGWDSNINDGATLNEELDPNLLNLTALSDASQAIDGSYGRIRFGAQWITPTSLTSGRSFGLQGHSTLYPGNDAYNQTGVNARYLSRKASDELRGHFALSGGYTWIGSEPWQLSLGLGGQVTRPVWGPLWAGVVGQTSIGFAQSGDRPHSITDAGGVVLSAEERQRRHQLTIQYARYQQTGQDDGHLEWQGLSNRYRLNWALPYRLEAQASLRHDWRRFDDNDLLFTESSGSDDLKRRVDNLLQIDLALNWQADTWLQSRTGLRLEWLESNINAYSRDNWVISQTLTVTF
ncbi:FecR domain-containing protein [Saccharospirillum salsuginis]|nr:FecR domain-containing protein [Saccharospirillum salsuginis]